MRWIAWIVGAVVLFVVFMLDMWVSVLSRFRKGR
jgi:hypothetical protein